jgi:hypothetical protein
MSWVRIVSVSDHLNKLAAAKWRVRVRHSSAAVEAISAVLINGTFLAGICALSRKLATRALANDLSRYLLEN